MKTFKKIIFTCLLFIGSLFAAKAQSHPDPNHIDPNSSYKDQIPYSKSNRFKDSFKNEQAEDVSARNYKQQQRKTSKGKKVAVKQNFDKRDKPDSANSKHPYGL